MRFLLDTATFIWAVSSPEKISRTAMSALQSEDAVREISAISLSEIAIKQARGKLTFGGEDVAKGVADLRLRVLAYTEKHALRLFDLPLHHFDPFDRQIIAQGMAENLALVTPDREFQLYEGLKTIW